MIVYIKPQEDNREVCPHMELLTIFSFSLEPSNRGKPWDFDKHFLCIKKKLKKDTKLVIIGQIGWKSNELLDQIIPLK
jgi:hypothetical protein